MDGLSSICNGLGSIREDKDDNPLGYAKGEYCSDNLKDLLRFLRRDDPEKRDVFKQVCKWNIVGDKLIPIIESYQDDRNLVLNAVKVLVFLTMPVEPTSVDIPQQIEYLWGLKGAITSSSIIPVIVSLLEGPLENLENESFTDDDWKLVQLILTLFRNLLGIHDITLQQKAEGLATQFLSLRDRFLELLFQENVMDLILVLSQHTGGSHGYLRQDNMLLLEIFYYIFKGQDAELIVKSYLNRSKGEEDALTLATSLQAINKAEQEKRRLARIRNLNRYSQFSGTFTRVTLDGSKAVFKGNPCKASRDALLKSHKNERGRLKRTTLDPEVLPSTRSQILELLYRFMSQFLEGGYNALMQSVREDIEKEHELIQSSDVAIFFYVARFVMIFQYNKCLTSKKPNIDVDNESVNCNDDETLFNGSICGPIAETVNESMFLMVISKWRYAYEGLKQTNDYKFLSAAGSVLKVMIRMLDLVLKQSPEDSREPQIARVLLYKLFYDQTEEGMTRFILNLIKSFDIHKQSKSDLADLVECMHVVLRLVESLQARGTLRVSKKSRKKKTKKTSKDETVNEGGDSTIVDNATIHTEGAGSTCADNAITHNVVTCEDSADVSMLEKDILANHGFEGETDENIKHSALSNDPVLKHSDLGKNENEVDVKDRNGSHAVSRAYFGSDNSSGDEQPPLTDEVDFKVTSLVSALANNNLIQNLCWLLKYYKSNSVSTNHYILCMLKRICDDLELSPMLYQLSLLTIFYEILEEQKLTPCKDYENIVTFLKSFVRRMLRKMKSYPLLLVEILFWKTRKECHYISCGSMLNEINGMRNGNGGGGSTSGGNNFSEGQGWVPRSIADALGEDDFVDFGQDDQNEDDLEEEKESPESISDNEIAGIRNYDGKGHSAEDGPDIPLEGGKGLSISDEMLGRLKDLYEKYKDDPDFCELIARDLNANGDISKLQVLKSLKQLGFKVPAKRKLQKYGVSNRHGNKNGEVSTLTADPLQNSTIPKESISLSEQKKPRKRAHAFTMEQEQKIKDLFKQYHDHKRCSHMIAEAMDSTGAISANRISRKLKQLGLFVPKRKGSNKNLSDDDTGLSDRDPSPESAGGSDDDTLLSLKRRGKNKRNRGHTEEKHSPKIARKLSEDISDDELLSELVHKHKRSGSQKQGEKINKNLSEDISDDEFLSVMKSKKTPREHDNDVMMDTSEKNNASGSDTDTQILERGRTYEQTNEMGAVHEDTAMANNSSDQVEDTGAIGMDSTNALDETVKNEELPFDDDELVDEMADFKESGGGSSRQENSVSRRRLRMVIDFDDDE